MRVAGTHRTATGRVLVAFALAVAVVAATAGCGASSSTKGNARPVFTNPRKPIKVRFGQVFEVHLSANASAGLSWRVGQTAPQLVREVGARYVAPNANRVGASGTAVIRFKAIARGHGGLGLAYVGPGRTAAAIRTVTFELTVS